MIVINVKCTVHNWAYFENSLEWTNIQLEIWIFEKYTNNVNNKYEITFISHEIATNYILLKYNKCATFKTSFKINREGRKLEKQREREGESETEAKKNDFAQITTAPIRPGSM